MTTRQALAFAKELLDAANNNWPSIRLPTNKAREFAEWVIKKEGKRRKDRKCPIHAPMM